MPSKPKAKPVEVTTPYQDVATYVMLNDDKKAAERTLKSLKPRIDGLLPTNRDAMIFDRDDDGKVPIYRGKKGEFKVVRVKQDRREVDDDLLATMLREKGLYEQGTTTTTRVDQEKVKGLLEDHHLTKADIEKCMVGAKYSYILVTFEEKK